MSAGLDDQRTALGGPSLPAADHFFVELRSFQIAPQRRRVPESGPVRAGTLVAVGLVHLFLPEANASPRPPLGSRGMALVKRIIIVRWLHRKPAARPSAAYQHRAESAQLW